MISSPHGPELLWVHHVVSSTSAARVTASQPGRHALTHRPPPAARHGAPLRGNAQPHAGWPRRVVIIIALLHTAAGAA
ncbi:hypothetical protein GGR70_004171 [Xanthomonas campestris]|nr:hypothetical protein [Xanthomonas campestris]